MIVEDEFEIMLKGDCKYFFSFMKETSNYSSFFVLKKAKKV